MDIFWLKEESGEGAEGVQEPEEIVSEAVNEIQEALDSLNEIALILGDRSGRKQESPK